ncbi:MAG: response regulator [candidate division Zixibacteria bacterium]|nr:response regulator [candidate division Zixibacteria bacterium]
MITRRVAMSKRKILVVDDEKDIITTVSTRLKAKGFDVITAMDGKQATETAKAELPDLILLDIGMPICDGHAVAQQLREYDKTASIPIIFLTARTSEEDFLSAYDEKVCKYVTKPFNPDELMGVIEEVLPTKAERA